MTTWLATLLQHYLDTGAMEEFGFWTAKETV